MNKLLLQTSFLTLFLVSFNNCKEEVFKQDIISIIGVENIEIRNSKSLTDIAGFGKGISLEIYELDKGSILKFQNKNSKVLLEKNIDKSWKKSDWKKPPLDNFDQKIIICLNYLGGNEKLEFELNNLKKVLENRDNYFAYYYKPFKEFPMGSQLFILDTFNSKLYCLDFSI